jgi:NAD dependent epimerase/dehydratase family enzyme
VRVARADGFTRTLGRVLFVPERLQQTGYAFRHPELDGALRHLLGADPFRC